jgi:Domain of unknown function (DUF4410)
MNQTTTSRSVSLLRTFALLTSLLFFTSCARTKITRVSSTSETLPKPGMVIVHDFSVSPDQVALDHTIGLRLQELIGSETDAKERLRVAQKIASLVSSNVVQDLCKLGYHAVAASAAPTPTIPSLTIEGQFFSIDQGNKRLRMIIGFGLGASEVRVLVQAFDNTQDGPQLVEDFYATVKSSRRPGAGPMAGTGALVVNAAVSGATSGTLSVPGVNTQSVEADARHLANSISNEIKLFFTRQGWSPPKKSR